MKKYTYILFAVLIVGLSIQPISNSYKALKADKDKSSRENYLKTLTEDLKFEGSYKEMRKNTPKSQRPDLRGLREYKMTYDLSTGTVPKERLLSAMETARFKRNSLEYQNRMVTVDWEERGPNNTGGRTRAIMFDPNDNKKLWAAGISGGLWYNNDITTINGVWTLVDDSWASISVSSIAYDPNDTNIMYVGTGERMGNYVSGGSNYFNFTPTKGLGIWKTTDGGATWNQLSSTTDFHFVPDIEIRNESGTSVLYIAVAGNYTEGYVPAGRDNIGLWKSADGGATWERAYDGQESNGYKEPASIDIDSNGRIWFGTKMNSYWSGGGQLFYSDDGSNWTEANLGLDALQSPDRVLVSVAQSDPNYVYALISKNNPSKAEWLVRTSDGGTTWETLGVPRDDIVYTGSDCAFGDCSGQAGYSMSFAVDPTNPNVLYGGGLDVYKSTDGGDNWTQITDGLSSAVPYMHVDQHGIEFAGGNVIFSNDGGVFFSNDAGANIYDRNTGYKTTQFYTIALHPDASSKDVLGGTQDNGSIKVSGSGAQDGEKISSGDGGYAHIDQLDPNYQFTGSNYNTIYRTTNGGSSWSLYSNYDNPDGSDSGTLINPTIIDSGTKTIYVNMYGGGNTSGNELMVLNDYTQLASRRIINIPLGSQVSSFAISPHTDDVIYIGTEAGKIFKVVDASTTNYSYTEISGSNIQGNVSSIDVGQNENQILATVSNYGAVSVFETYSGGGSNGWANIEGDLPDMPVRAGLYNRDNYNQVIIGTDLGTWVSDDISVDSPVWNPSSNGMGNVRVDMLKSRTSDGAIAAGTYGRGMFFSSGFTSTAPLNAAFTPNKTSGVAPLEVTFNDRSSSNTTWSWNFGDGNTSTVASPTNTFASPGTYSVSLTVSDGSATDTVTKNNLIFVTSVQDTLWSDGFENCFGLSYPLNGRNNYGWVWRDANGDNDGPGCYPESLNAGFDLAYEEDKGMGFGNAAADATVWDDWFISPELWLRPGVDNLLKFYANGFNATYAEEFDVMLSPSGGTQISDFTETLANVVDTDAVWAEYSYDLTPWAGQKVRVAIHHKSAEQYYEFYDYFLVTAGQLSDAGAPSKPYGIEIERALIHEDTNGDGEVDESDTWNQSDTAITLYWNRNGEPDLSSYNVYASQTDGFTADSNSLLGQGTIGDISIKIPVVDANDDVTILNDNYFNMRTFGADSYTHENLTTGQTWYYRIGAVDNDGNETLSDQVSYVLDTQNPSSGTITVNNLVDGGYLRSLTDLSVSVDGFSDDTGIVQYRVGVQDATTSANAGQQIFNAGDNLTLTGLSLEDRTIYNAYVYAIDGAGNESDVVTSEFTTYVSLLGDYDADFDVDVEDLNAFVNAWPNAGIVEAVDIGPATGTAPYLIPTPDNVNDIKDVSVFARNWLWTKSQGRSAENTNLEIVPIDFEAELIGNEIRITLPDGITAGKFELQNTNKLIEFSSNTSTTDLILLQNKDDENELYELEFGKLSDINNTIIITVNSDQNEKPDLSLTYQLFNENGLAGNGIMEIRNPDEFKLYQNYPNPFRNQTTIKYDIPSLMVNNVPTEIHIYNTLGQVVRKLDEGDKAAGQYTVIWDGKNDDGEQVSSGVYFYQLRTKVDGQSNYNKTMKMVLVR